MSNQTFFTLKLDKKGGALSVQDHPQPAENEIIWSHFKTADITVKQTLENRFKLNEEIIEAMLAHETRPRCVVMENGIFIILRALNENPNEQPDDMIGLRIWVEKNRIISLAKSDITTIETIKESLLAHQSTIKSIAEFLDELSDDITNKTALYLDNIDRDIAHLEAESLKKPSHKLRATLAETRSQIIALRRYLLPQHKALIQLAHISRFPWLSTTDAFKLQETSDRTMRCVEDLDEARDRASVIQETISNHISERLERRMYVLSLIAAIFLPLSFITGLLGINVGGIPGERFEFAFLVVIFILALIAVFEFYLFKKKKWL